MIKIITTISLFITLNCFGQTNPKEFADKTAKQEAIIKEHLENGAWQHMMFSKEWQDNIDMGLKKIVQLLIYGNKKQCLILNYENMK